VPSATTNHYDTSIKNDSNNNDKITSGKLQFTVAAARVHHKAARLVMATSSCQHTVEAVATIALQWFHLTTAVD